MYSTGDGVNLLFFEQEKQDFLFPQKFHNFSTVGTQNENKEGICEKTLKKALLSRKNTNLSVKKASRFDWRRYKNGGGFKEKIKYPFSGLFQNIITKIHTIFLQVQHRDFPAPNRYFVYVIPLLKISASFDSFRHFYTRTEIFLLN